ncbi:MAG: protein kinase [Polyangiaceae bacterium]
MSSPANLASGITEDPHGPLKIGSRLRKYEILALIGRGGHASVYHARDTIFRRDVAIKVIHRLGEVTEDMVLRGQSEARFLSQMRHPNIVEVYDADITDGGLLYIVMELLVGRTLFEVLREHRRLAVEETLNIGVQIATAVEAAHQLGAIHRDLKPENIFITADNVAKVLDFGIAKFFNDVAAKTTAKDALQGSVLYMSPEHVQSKKVGPRTDIYALGIVLYRILYGEHPVLMELENPTPWAVAAWHMNQMPKPLYEIAPWIPRHVSRIVSCAVAKDLRDRQGSMAELAGQLQKSWDRFIAETQGELKGKHRDLSRPMVPGEPSLAHVLSSGAAPRFQAFHSASASVRPPEEAIPTTAAKRTIPGMGSEPPASPRDLPTAAVRRAESLASVPVPTRAVERAADSVRFVRHHTPAMPRTASPATSAATPAQGAPAIAPARAVATRVVVPTPTSVALPVSVPGHSQPRKAPSTWDNKANLWLIGSAISGALVFGAATKAYFVYRRHDAATERPSAVVAANAPAEKLAEPLPSAPPDVATAPSAMAPPPEPSTAPTSAPATSAQPKATPPPVQTRAAAKAKTAAPGDRYVKALEEDLKRREAEAAKRAPSSPKRTSPELKTHFSTPQ